MKKIILLITFFLQLNFQVGFSQDFNTNEYAFSQNEKLGQGVNIIGYDPIWNDFSKARMQPKHFQEIKKAGFSNVRIKISPFRFSTDKSYTIDKKFFTTLDWAVNQALENNLYPIIDFHEHHAMQADPIGTMPMFLAMWNQIATHYKDYSNNVFFEIANEPNMKPETWNKIHHEAYQIIRKSNPDRTLLIGTINGNQIKFLKDLELPENDRNIIVAIHYYEPIQFTHQGAPWSTKNKDLRGITWTNSPEEEKAVIEHFNVAQTWSQTHNRPLTLGEFGAYEVADMPSRIRWTNFIARQAEARNWSWSYWQFDSDFIVYDIDKNQWNAPIKEALLPFKKKINTVNGLIDGEKMGFTLTHEHIMSNYGVEIEKTNFYDEEKAFAQIIPYLKNLKKLGVETVFDCTTAYFGRRVDLLQKIAKESGIQIVSNTGFYAAANDKYVPKEIYAMSTQEIANIWIDEFENGIDNTNIKPGFIKLAFDDGKPSDIDKKLFEAGVLAHKKTGLSIAVHTGNNKDAIETQLEILSKNQVKPSALVFVHANKLEDISYLLKLSMMGVWISLDGVKSENIATYVTVLKQFKSNGLLHKVLISHDGNSYSNGKPIRPYDAVSNELIPSLKKAGFTLSEINLLTIDNPLMAFSVKVKTY